MKTFAHLSHFSVLLLLISDYLIFYKLIAASFHIPSHHIPFFLFLLFVFCHYIKYHVAYASIKTPSISDRSQLFSSPFYHFLQLKTIKCVFF